MRARAWKFIDSTLEDFALWILARLDARALKKITTRAL
jgi:hypothetical protein